MESIKSGRYVDDNFKSFLRKSRSQESLGNSQDSGIENRAGEGEQQTEVKVGMANGHKAENNGKADEPTVAFESGEADSKEKQPSVWRNLAQCLGSTFLFAALMKFFHDALLFVNPYLLRQVSDRSCRFFVEFLLENYSFSFLTGSRPAPSLRMRQKKTTRRRCRPGPQLQYLGQEVLFGRRIRRSLLAQTFTPFGSSIRNLLDVNQSTCR